MSDGIAVSNNASQPRLIPSSGTWVVVFRRLFKNKLAVAGLLIFVMFYVACAMAPYLTKWEYTAINADDRLSGPTRTHILGTDELGRDLFSRLLYGGRITLKIALVSTALAALAGGIIGLIAGYFGGRIDIVISPILDTLASIPVILLVLVTEAVMGWGKGYFMYALALAAVPQFGQLVRATVMNIMEREYIEAAQALGVSHAGIMLRHVLHNVAGPFVIRFTSCVTEMLLTCTILGYLQVGIGPPTPEWGAIAYSGKAHMRTNPQFMLIPCAAITISVISVSLFGDGLRNALDPREGDA